jgi:hypothetical protein
MSSTIQRLAPAASSLIQYASGFFIGSIAGTATYFYINREAVNIGEQFSGITTIRWASSPVQVGKGMIENPSQQQDRMIVRLNALSYNENPMQEKDLTETAHHH